MRRSVLVAFLALAAQAFGPASPLRLTVRPPHFAIWGNDIEVRVHVTAADDLRMLTVVVDSGEFYRSYTEEVHPTDPATRRSLWIQRPPPGRYAIVAVLFERGKGGWVECARQQTETQILWAADGQAAARN